MTQRTVNGLKRRLCILCKRAEIARAFINIRIDGMGVKTMYFKITKPCQCTGEYV